MSSKYCSKLSRKDLDEIYINIVTKLSQLLLETEGLLIVGATTKKDINYYVEEGVVDQISDLLDKINSKRLAHKHGIENDNKIQDVIFLEEHPTFLLKKFLDKLNDV